MTKTGKISSFGLIQIWTKTQINITELFFAAKKIVIKVFSVFAFHSILMVLNSKFQRIVCPKTKLI